jgi:multimeric flavodoxin WrbA
MKIVALVGSPNKGKGNTAALVDLVMDGINREGANGEVVYLPGNTVRPCKACDICHIKGVCPQKDEFLAIKKKIMAADGVILATPNYILHVSAQLKCFIDRCCGVVHLLEFKGKYGVSVVTSGGGDEEPIARYLERFMVWTGVVPVGSVWATMGGEERMFSSEAKAQAVGLGQRLVKACRTKERFAGAEEEMKAFRDRMRWLMENRKDLWHYEYDYWKTHLGL